ncbi:hypothetical protein ACWJJH_00225 [Endozoicomonadaceae bacterium StTr2]
MQTCFVGGDCLSEDFVTAWSSSKFGISDIINPSQYEDATYKKESVGSGADYKLDVKVPSESDRQIGRMLVRGMLLGGHNLDDEDITFKQVLVFPVMPCPLSSMFEINELAQWLHPMSVFCCIADTEHLKRINDSFDSRFKSGIKGKNKLWQGNNEHLYTSLHIAARCRNFEFISSLIELCPDKKSFIGNVSDCGEGVSALAILLERKEHELLGRFVSMYAGYLSEEIKGLGAEHERMVSFFHSAWVSGNYNVYRSMSAACDYNPLKDQMFLNSFRRSRTSALHAAVERKSFEMVCDLLDSCCSYHEQMKLITSLDGDGLSVSQVAIKTGFVDVVPDMLAQAKVSDPVSPGRAVRNLAEVISFHARLAEKEHEEVLAIQKDGIKSEQLAAIRASGNAEVLAKLEELKAQLIGEDWIYFIMQTDHKGLSLLHHAVLKGWQNIIEYIHANCESEQWLQLLMLKKYYSGTALHMAVTSNKEEAFIFLIENCPDSHLATFVMEHNLQGENAFHIASRPLYCRKNMLRILLRTFGNRPVAWAVTQEVEGTSSFLKNEVLLDVNKERLSTLHMLLVLGDEVLLDEYLAICSDEIMGPLVKMQDVRNHNVLHLAAGHQSIGGFKRVYALVEKYGEPSVLLKQKSVEGNYPLDECQNRSQSEDKVAIEALLSDKKTLVSRTSRLGSVSKQLTEKGTKPKPFKSTMKREGGGVRLSFRQLLPRLSGLGAK